jgi:hypothetical protein
VDDVEIDVLEAEPQALSDAIFVAVSLSSVAI